MSTPLTGMKAAFSISMRLPLITVRALPHRFHCVTLLDSQTISLRHRTSDPHMLLSKEYVGYLAREVTKKLIAAKAIETSAVPKVAERVHAALLEEPTPKDPITDGLRDIPEA